jgi:hypothetical protein
VSAGDAEMRFRIYYGNVYAFSDYGSWVLETHGALEAQYWTWEALTEEQAERTESAINELERRL